MIDGLKPYDECKASEVPWLGEIPRHWDTRRNRYIFREVDARSTTGEETQLSMSQIHGLVESSKIDTWRMRSESYVGGKLCEPDDLVLNRLKAHLGVFAHAKMGGVISPDYSVFRPRTDAYTRYFEKVLKTPQCVGEIRRFTKGIVEGFWRLYTDDFYNLTLPVPPPEEQAGIVRFLDHADRKIKRYIRAKRKLIELLNEQKQAIIHRAVTRGLDPHVKLKPSGVEWLGDVPEHWESKRLRHISPQITVGVVVNPSSYFDDSGSIPMLLGNNIREDNFLLDDVRRIDVVSDRVLSKSRLYAGDLVVVRVGAPGVAAVIPESLNGCNCASVVIVRRSPTFNSRWLMHLFNSQILRSQIDVVKYGAAQKQFNISHAVNFWCPFPPLDEQVELVNAIDNEVRSLDGAIDDAFESISLLHEYRTRLIADVVTGKLDVREAAAALPDELEATEPDAEELLDEDDTTDDVELDTEPEEVEA